MVKNKVTASKGRADPLHSRFLDPENVGNLAYAYYVADDSVTNSSSGRSLATLRLARRTVKDFEAWKKRAKFGSNEWKYLFDLSGIIVSLSRDISRSKVDLTLRIQLAVKQKDEQLKEITGAVWQKSLIKGAMKAAVMGNVANIVRMMLFGSLGFFFMQGVSQNPEVSENTDPTSLSIAAGVAMTIVGFYMRNYMIESKRSRIMAFYESALGQAQMACKRKLFLEYKIAKSASIRSWEEYTGDKYIEKYGYGHAMEDDLVYYGQSLELWERMKSNPVLKMLKIISERIRFKKKSAV